MLEVLVWLLFGTLAGWIASMLTDTNAHIIGLANLAVGLLGAMIGGFVMRYIAGRGVIGYNLSSLLVAVGLSVILLFLFNNVRSKT